MFKRARPYSGDVLQLPVGSVDEALPFYEAVMGFRVVSRAETPFKSAVLEKDAVQIGLSENGGDPAQNGSFFEVDDVEATFAELKSRGLKMDDAGYRVDRYGTTSWRVFFITAPDGLCYCLGQRQE